MSGSGACRDNLDSHLDNIPDWCNDCHGYTHMPYCPSYEESGTVPANATGMSTLEQAQALTRDWNQKSRFEQILIRHQIWGNSALPDSEYTASWNDVKLLIKQNERLREALRFQKDALHDLCDDSDTMTSLPPMAHAKIANMRDDVDTALNHAEQGEGS